jgi:hypothetical protein
MEQPVMNAVRRVGRSGRYILGEQVQTTESGSRLVVFQAALASRRFVEAFTAASTFHQTALTMSGQPSVRMQFLRGVQRCGVLHQ